MRFNVLLPMLTIAMVGTGASAQQAAGFAVLGSSQPAMQRVETRTFAAITSVSLAGEGEEGFAQYLVAGLLTPNTTAHLFAVVSGEGSRGMVASPDVRSNSSGQFYGLVSIPAEAQLEALYLVALNGDSLAAWMAPSGSETSGIVAGDWGFARIHAIRIGGRDARDARVHPR